MRDTDVEQAVTEELCRLVRTAVASEKVNVEESRHEKIHSVKVAYERVGNTTSRMVLISMDEGCLARTFRQSYILIQNMRMKILKHIRGKWADIQKLQVTGVSDELTDNQLQEAFEEFGEVVEMSREVTTTNSDESFMDSFRNIKSGRLRVFISNKAKKEFERWDKITRLWNANGDTMERVFIRLHKLTKGYCKGLYVQYMWLFLHDKLWTRDRQRAKLGPIFEDAGKGTLCPLCMREEESIRHMNVCNGYLRIIDEKRVNGEVDVFHHLLRRPKWVITCFAVAWKERNGFFYGDQVHPTPAEEIITKVNWEWETRPRQRRKPNLEGQIV
eukprot:Nk52_evm3s751 gene=Nk52_evmTU3s751